MKYDHYGKNNKMSSSSSGGWVKATNRIFGICLLTLGLAACGGGSGGDGDNQGNDDPGANTPVFGQTGANACLITNTNQVDLACYLVPGEAGEMPELTFAAYLRDSSGNFKLTGSVDTYRWHDITANSAQYDLGGETTHFDWVDNVGYNGNGSITQTDSKGEPEQDELTRPLRPLIDAKEVVTNIGEDGTLTGHLKVFEPKTRTISLPGTNDTIQAHNAIMLVQKVAFSPGGLGLVSIEYYVPEVGPVAQINYLGCPDVAALSFRDDAAYYETKCASSLVGQATLHKAQ